MTTTQGDVPDRPRWGRHLLPLLVALLAGAACSADAPRYDVVIDTVSGASSRPDSVPFFNDSTTFVIDSFDGPGRRR